MGGRDGDVVRPRIIVLPGGARVGGCRLFPLRGGLGPVPDDLCHLHHPLALRSAFGHGEEFVRGQTDADGIGITVGPVGKIIHSAAAAPQCGHTHGRIEK